MPIIASQDFNALSGSTSNTDQLPSGAQLTNTASFSISDVGINFSTFWVDTRAVGTGPVTPTSDTSDFIGVNSFAGGNAPDVGADGTAIAANVEQNFQFNDGDGALALVFSAVDLSGFTNRSFSIDYWITDTGYEADDAFRIVLEDSGTGDATLLDFGEVALEANVSADDGTANWSTLTVDLEPILAGGLGDTVTLNVIADTNSGTENIFVDNIVFDGDAAAPVTPLISEFQPNPTGTDPSTSTFELSGAAAEDFAGWILSVETDVATGQTVDRATEVAGTFDGNGLLTVDVPDLENPSFTVILTDSFTGAIGDEFDTSLIGTVFDAIGVPDSVADEANNIAASLGGTDFSFTGDEPRLIFRDASTGDLYAVNDPDNGAVFDINGLDVTPAIFDIDPTTGTDTFGTINPSVAPVVGTQLSIDDVTVAEADGTATFTVTRSGDLSGPTTVDFATADGTATAGSDYVTNSGTVSFAADEVSQTITVDITDDAVAEDDETFTVTLSNASGGATLSDAEGVGTIQNDDVDIVSIFEIQGAGHVSGFVSATPLDPTTGDGDGQRVTTTGIVTAVDSNGFYLQDPTGDGDIATSDAIFVFTGSAPGVAVGDELQVEGTVSEFYPGGQGTRNLSTTQLSGNPDITVLSTGNALPTAVVLGAGGRILPSENIEDDRFTSFDPTTDGIDFYESIEGMLVTVSNAVTVSGTNRFGEVYVVADGGADATGLSNRGTLNISPDDFNPEKIQIDWDSTVSPTDAINVSVGAAFDTVVGVVSYSFGNYEIVPTEVVAVIGDETPLTTESTELASGEDTLSIASYNVLNLDTNDADGDTDVLDGRFTSIAEQIVNNLNSPDIIGLQEVQDNSGSDNDGVTSASETLQALIDAIDLADDGAMNDSTGYAFIDNTFITNNQSGGQPGGNIRTAFLYNEERVSLVDGSVQTIGTQDPGGSFEGARLPLVASFLFDDEEITVVNNHFSSKGGSAPILGVEQDFAARQEEVTINGSLDERQAQSAAVQTFVSSTLADDAEANVVVLGDFNEFEFVSPITGLEDAGLTNLTNTLAANERYTFNFQGNSQSLDHILVSDALVETAQFDVVHTNSEFAATEDRASDHDPLVALFSFEESAPETSIVAVELESRGFGSRFAETVDDVVVDTGRAPVFINNVLFNDVDVRVDAAAPGFELATFIRGELGIYSRGDSFFRGDFGLVDGRETLSLEMSDGPFGDALQAIFDFGTVRGNGDVDVSFFNDGELIGTQTVDARTGEVAIGLDGVLFDAVELSGVGNTGFGLVGFAFERETSDGLDIA